MSRVVNPASPHQHSSRKWRLLLAMAAVLLTAFLVIGAGGMFVQPAQAQEEWPALPTETTSPAGAKDLPRLSEPMGPDAAACGTVIWVNPTNSPEPNSSISVNLWKNGIKKILDTPLGKLDFGGGNTSYAFCTDIYHFRPVNRTMCLDSGFFSDWRVAWLVTHYPPTVNDAVQQAARQAVVWRFTDGCELDQVDSTLYNTAYDTAVRNAYNGILAAIPSSLPAEYQPGNVQITNEPASSSNFLPAQPVHPFKVRLAKGGYPLVGYTVTVTTTFGTLDRASGVTDSNGEAFFTLTSTAPGTATIMATAILDLPAGSRFIDQVSPDTWQRLVLGQTTRLTVQSVATKTWLNQDNLIIVHKFEDRNFNQVQDDDEPDLAGWSFVLRTPGGQFAATTDSSGSAYFANVISGNGAYTLTETLQSGWINTTLLSQGRVRSEADLWTQWRADFGNAQYSVLDVFKYLDVDGDGAWDAGSEPPLPGWQFALYIWQNGDWAQYRGGSSGLDGRLTFTDLASGQYKIVEQLANHPGYANTTPLEQQLTLGYPARQEVRFGNRGALTLSGTKWNDADGNGVRGVGELGLPGWTIRLVGGPRAVQSATVTAADGSYIFADLEPGTYTLSEVSQAGWVQTAPAGGSHVVVMTTASAGGLDFGNVQAASLGDLVWYDHNANGIQDAGEPGMDGVTVRLFRADGTPVGSTVTGGGGLYGFTGLVPGTYFLVFVSPAGYVLSPQGRGGDTAVDSDPNPSTGRTANIPLAAGQNDPTWDSGLSLVASFGDFVYVSQGGGPPDPNRGVGLPNVPIRVTGLDISGATVDITATSSITGYYLVTNLLLGTYTAGVPAVFDGVYLGTPSLLTFDLTSVTPRRLDIDFGYTAVPTAVNFLAFEAIPSPKAVQLLWSVAGVEGGEEPCFHVWRAVPGGAWKRLTQEPSFPASRDGGVLGYVYVDLTVERSMMYLYSLEAGDGTRAGPLQVSVPIARDRLFYLPFLGR
jgi:hypothetical protein